MKPEISVFMAIKNAFMGFSRHFHGIFIKKRFMVKLEAYKLNRSALLWFKSHLTDRTQLVSFKGQTSTVRTITAGVPQGSILGPLLFVSFINDLPLNVHTRINMFADDTTLLASSDYLNVEELKNTITRGLQCQ